MVHRRALASIFSVIFASVGVTIAPACAGGQCTGGQCAAIASIDHTFPLGSRWRFSVERCPCEGLVFTDIRYTPRNGVERLVLRRANVAQIHVAYHAGEPRFQDLTVATEGMGVLAVPLVADECQDGALHGDGLVCEQIERRGYAWKYSTSYALGEEISIFMSSQLGEYNYINHWSFRDDGVIEPRMGLTGRLPVIMESANYLPYGSRLDPEPDPVPEVGLSHLHNVYYRLDFDVGGPSDDAVDRIAYRPSFAPSPDAPCEVKGHCGRDIFTRLDRESIEHFSANEYTSWRVFDRTITNADGRLIGYEIIPEIEGIWSGMVTAGEPWSQGELWVTRYDPCELLAFGNSPPYTPSYCSGAAADVSEMVDDESVRDEDLVVWYAARFRHFVRDEDGPEMPVEWVGFRIAPRSFFHQNPLQ